MQAHELVESLSLDSFTAFDVETTGLDSEKDEIIEIGMVWLKSGQVAESYQSLFKPSAPVPPQITKLTGIRDADCEQQPPISQKLPEILDFLNGRWIVAHHADFDYRFLSRAVQRFNPDLTGPSYSKVIDTLELCRILLPYLSNHRLDTLTDTFGIPFPTRHRALADAEAAGRLFDKLVPLILELDIDAIRTINRILNGASDGLRLFFGQMEVLKTKSRLPHRNPIQTGPPNILGRKSAAVPSEDVQRVPLAEVTDFFAAGGILSGALSKYEPRKPQMDMAKWVTRALNEDAFLVAEAGTGVGKTLAYLIPTLFWVIRNPGQKSVVSTHTRTLQDQLFYKDLPLLEKCFPDSFSAVLLKGRSNYLCLARWENLLRHSDERLILEQRRKLLPLVVWMSSTRTGDIEENSGFSRESNEDIWSQINCETRHCRNRECPHETRCFLQNVRKASRSADIVVVNHSLLFSTLSGFQSMLGEYKTLIVDEAHQIEKTASQYLGIKLGAKGFSETGHWIYHAKPVEGGLLVSMANTMKSARIDRSVRIQTGQAIHRLKSLALELHQAADALFKSLDRQFFQVDQEKPDRWKVRIRDNGELLRVAAPEMTRLDETLVQSKQEWTGFMDSFGRGMFSDGHENPETSREMESVLEKLGGLHQNLQSFLHPDCANHAVWVECAERGSGREITLCSVPIDVGDLLAQCLYPRIQRGIFTSATLAVGERFDHVIHRWGLNRVEPDRMLTRIFGSPFDYGEQVLFLIPTFLSNPKEEGFAKELSDLLSRVMVSHPKGTLVLFTSHGMLKQVYHSVQPALDEKGIRMLGQGIDGSRTSILRMFQQDVRSVLFGTSSFWEGVDVPGQALELLIITRIPFDVPTEPLIEARMERIQQEKGSSFFHYAVPEAIVRFRQGFGRLIRTCEDRGVILMTDHRMVQTAYGSLFLNSLPVEAKLCKSETELLSHLDQWFSS